MGRSSSPLSCDLDRQLLPSFSSANFWFTTSYHSASSYIFFNRIGLGRAEDSFWKLLKNLKVEEKKCDYP